MRRGLVCLIFVLLINVAAPSGLRAQDNDSNQDDAPRYIPPGPRKSVEIGDFYFKKKKYAGALSRYKEALKSDSHYAPAYLGLGKVYEKMGLKQKALENYQRYLDELPSTKQADEATDVHRAIKRLEKEIGRKSAENLKSR